MYKFEDKVVYQVYPKSFNDTNEDGIGDINGIIEKLDYLKDLGVDYIWSSPINVSPQHDNGYDIADYYEIDPMFGTKDDYKSLITEANKRGIKIMLDLVLNHVSDEHIWFKKALKGDEKYMDYFIWRDEPNEIKSFFSKPAWTYNEKLGKYYFHLFDTHQPDLNWENEEVRKEIYKMVNYWVDFGVEGFRLDVIDLIGKEPDKLITGKGPKFYEYLKELHNNTFKDKLLTVGECWDSSLEESYKMTDQGLTQIFHFTEQIITNGESKWYYEPLNLELLFNNIVTWHNDYKGSQTKVMDNHDLPRLSSLWLDDQEYRYESCTMLLSLFASFRGTLYLFQGDEFGMTNDDKNTINLYDDVESHNIYSELKETTSLSDKEIMNKIKLISRDNARTPVQWTKNGGFSNAKPWLEYNYRYQEINLETDLNSDKSIFNYYRKFLEFRKENYTTFITSKIAEVIIDNDVVKVIKENSILYFNFSKETHSIQIEEETLFSNTPFNEELGPYQFIMLTRNK